MTVFDLRLEWLVTQEYFFNNPVRLQRGDVGEIQTGMCVCVSAGLPRCSDFDDKATDGCDGSFSC